MSHIVKFKTEEAWMTKFEVVQHRYGHYLVVIKGHTWSHNMIKYKTKSGAKKGAAAAFNKINKEFEKILLK